jgi:hypothetical protein
VEAVVEFFSLPLQRACRPRDGRNSTAVSFKAEAEVAEARMFGSHDEPVEHEPS